MLFIVGLGNPGAKYLMTRHNFGFMVVDAFLSFLGGNPFTKEKQCLISKVSHSSRPLLLVKPQTYMNCSGEAFLSLIQFYGLKPFQPENLLLIHDDMDQAYGSFLYQKGRGDGGHNGVKNVHQSLKTKDHYRLRIGVGRDMNAPSTSSSYVLSAFSKEEQKNLPSLLTLICESLECFIKKGYASTASQFNRKML